MLDKFIVEGLWGPVQPHHANRLAEVSYRRFLQSKTKPTTTFINSPLTGAQIEIKYLVRPIDGQDIGYVQIAIPVASALVGHNHFHEGLAALPWEVLCTGQLVRIVLLTISMTETEIDQYIRSAVPILGEVTWHNRCETPEARKALQERTKAHMKAVRSLSARHDVGVMGVDVEDTNSGICLLVSLKSGDQFRQYCKREELQSRRRRTRRYEKGLPRAARERLADILDELDLHARNELLVGWGTLKELGVTHPSHLKDTEKVRHMIDTVWNQFGFGERGIKVDLQAIGPAARDTLTKFLTGEDVLESLPPSTGTRHRQAILNAGGPDIALVVKGRRFNPANLGYQLNFDRRWRVPDDLLDLVVSDRTGPGLLEELQRGLAYLQTGELPDLASSEAVKDWRERWDAFRTAQQLDDDTLASCGAE